MRKLLFIYFYIIFLSISNNSQANNDIKERFIVIGHLYPILADEVKLKKFVNKINSYNPDYLFILGDSEIQNKKIYKKYSRLFNTEIYFAPGNQELKKSKDNYLENVGYFDLQFEKKKAKFLIINSSDEVGKIKERLKIFLSKEFTKGPTILLTHHRIWDDTQLSTSSFQHDKSYYFDEIYPIIKGKIDYIFAGNSKRQYFKDLSDSPAYGKQNINNIFWFDKIGDINAYSVGMGDGSPKANFTIVDIFENELIIKGDYSTIENYHILPRNLLELENYHNLDQRNLAEVNEIESGNINDKKKYFFVNKFKLYITILIIFTFCVLFFVFKKKK